MLFVPLPLPAPQPSILPFAPPLGHLSRLGARDRRALTCAENFGLNRDRSWAVAPRGLVLGLSLHASTTWMKIEPWHYSTDI
jgi:hypothetical protein